MFGSTRQNTFFLSGPELGNILMWSIRNIIAFGKGGPVEFLDAIYAAKTHVRERTNRTQALGNQLTQLTTTITAANWTNVMTCKPTDHVVRVTTVFTTHAPTEPFRKREIGCRRQII